MQTNWSGFALEDNIVFADVLTAYACRVMLSNTPGVVTTITLPPNARVVRLFTAQDVVRYAIDMDPLILTTTEGLLLDFNAFVPGDRVQPGYWQAVALADTSTTHELRLVSEEPNAVVQVIALLDGPAA